MYSAHVYGRVNHATFKSNIRDGLTDSASYLLLVILYIFIVLALSGRIRSVVRMAMRLSKFG